MKRENKLNDLDGSSWLRFTKSWWSPDGKWMGQLDPLDSWWESDYPVDPTHKLRSTIGCAKPPSIGRDLTLMFSKRGEWVLDTFAGTCGLILGACLADRKAMAVDLREDYLKIAKKIKKNFVIVDESSEITVKRKKKVDKIRTEIFEEVVEVWEPTFYPADSVEAKKGRKIRLTLEADDCMEVLEDLEDESIDFIMTDPPYGVKHTVSFTSESKMDNMQSEDPADLANLQTYQQFLVALSNWGVAAYRVLRKGRYVAMFMGDRYENGETMPLGWGAATALRRAGFKLKGVKVWRNKRTQRPLKPYAVGVAYVPNIIHQYILIFQKEA